MLYKYFWIGNDDGFLMKVKILIFILSQTCNLFAQNYTNLQKQIKSELVYLDKMPHVLRENPDFDPEVYSSRVAKKLQKLLTFDESRPIIDTAYFGGKYYPLLKLSIQTDDKRNIRIYNFGYDCGGTRGSITHSVIQYTNDAGKLYTYDISRKINCRFFKIFLLQDDLYLLFGDEKAYGGCRTQTAYIIQFKGNYLILDYPAFIDRPDLNFCNVAFDYNQKTKVLTTQARLIEFSDGTKSYERPFELQSVYEDKNERNKWYSFLAIDYKNGNSILKFKNGTFHKTRKNNFIEFLGIIEE